MWHFGKLKKKKNKTKKKTKKKQKKKNNNKTQQTKQNKIKIKHYTISGLTPLVNLTMRSNVVSPLHNMGRELNGFTKENNLIVSLVILFSS